MANFVLSPAVRRAIALWWLAVGSMAAAGCGQAFDRDDAVAGFTAANPTATAAQSECVVDRLIDRYGLEGLEVELSADPADDDFTEVQFRDMFACGMEGDVRSQIVDQLVANDVSADDAPCVADALVDDLNDDDIDVLLSGDITDDFFSKFVSAMEQCGAIN
ncbi:MAG: hypothetical protein ACR2QK_07990 [Acidimicrobiales bacterium]